ncbi:hypothetical protein LDENG_00156070 [Lucifuga dentata]|nr:hypothetical protein LDENG_00156070 [Lucifuga dentata]
MAFIKKLFKNVVHDRDPDEETLTVKGKPEPKYYGTVTPYPNLNASHDASVLQSAIETHDVDEDVIISVLVKRNNEQRQKIKAVYEASTGEKLDVALKSALRRDLEDITLALLMPPAHYDAYKLRRATKGLGTHEDVLIEILATRSNQEILEIKRIFKKVYEEELDDVIDSDTSGDFALALHAMLKANKDESNAVDMELVQQDAEALFEAGENSEGIDIPVFIDILTKRNGPQLSKTFQRYARISDVSLPEALDMELKGDIEDCLTAIVKCAWNKPAFFAEKLHLAMKGRGTCDDTLIRVLVSRSEIDLQKIIGEYRAMYGRRLQEDILEDTKGHYQQVLIGLCGAH